jgi:hypothetical protein
VTGRYAVLAGRIRQDLVELEQVVERVERAVQAHRLHTSEQDLFLDSAVLNLHDFYTGLERIFTHIATNMDQTVPTGPDWHRELLRQMTVEIPGLRPSLLTIAMAGDVDEFLRFRHVVRHLYAFELEPDRVERLANRLRPMFREISGSLIGFAAFLDELARNG